MTELRRALIVIEAEQQHAGRSAVTD